MDSMMISYLISVVFTLIVALTHESARYKEHFDGDRSSWIALRILESLVPLLNLLLFVIDYEEMVTDMPMYKIHLRLSFIVGWLFLLMYHTMSFDWTLYASIGIFIGMPICVKLKHQVKDDYYYMD